MLRYTQVNIGFDELNQQGECVSKAGIYIHADQRSSLLFYQFANRLPRFDANTLAAFYSRQHPFLISPDELLYWFKCIGHSLNSKSCKSIKKIAYEQIKSKKSLKKMKNLCKKGFFGLLEIGEWRLENGDWRMEIGNWRMEIGEWRLEIGEWRIIHLSSIFL